jgi:predicted dehydrogenase
MALLSTPLLRFRLPQGGLKRRARQVLIKGNLAELLDTTVRRHYKGQRRSGMSNTIRVGFVGAGYAATFHYDSLMPLAGVGVSPHGVFSKRKESRESFASERGLKAFDTLDALLADVEAIHVCVPPYLHEHVAVSALKKDVHAIIEKPFTGYFGPEGQEDFRGNTFPKDKMRDEAVKSAQRMLDAEKASKAHIYYAENWVFAPAVQKEVEIIRKTKAQVLRVLAEESHSGSHSASYGIWKESGGGAIMGKGCHPLTAALFLKRVEGEARGGAPIRPKSVSARTHELTRIASYEDRGFLRTDYTDIEDYGLVHIVFEDGTIADVYASEVVMGGIHVWMEVFANNHRSRCKLSPLDAVETYNPDEAQFEDIYVVEKISTKQGWNKPAPDENWSNGFIQELSHFYGCIGEGRPSYASSELGYDTVSVIYSAYLSAERGGADVEVV